MFHEQLISKVKALMKEAMKGNIVLKISPIVINKYVFVLMGKHFNYSFTWDLL